MAEAYTDRALDHYRHPRNTGDLPGATAVGTAGNPADGDFLRLALRVENHRIVEVRFQCYGCPAAIASASMATELLTGRTVEEARALTREEIVAALGGLPAIKLDCSVLAPEAVRAALGAAPHIGDPASGRRAETEGESRGERI